MPIEIDYIDLECEICGHGVHNELEYRIYYEDRGELDARMFFGKEKFIWIITE